jgi:hypothetical protein
MIETTPFTSSFSGLEVAEHVDVELDLRCRSAGAAALHVDFMTLTPVSTTASPFSTSAMRARTWSGSTPPAGRGLHAAVLRDLLVVAEHALAVLLDLGRQVVTERQRVPPGWPCAGR